MSLRSKIKHSRVFILYFQIQTCKQVKKTRLRLVFSTCLNTTTPIYTRVFELAFQTNSYFEKKN